ncbi:MAG: hypothetical protein U1E47_06550 [Rivihabitans pingtungensis]
MLDVPLSGNTTSTWASPLHGEAAACTPLPPSPGLAGRSARRNAACWRRWPRPGADAAPIWRWRKRELSEAEVLATLVHWQAIGALRRLAWCCATTSWAIGPM